MADKLTLTLSIKKRWWFKALEWTLVGAVGFRLMSFERAASLLVKHGTRIIVA